MSSGRCGALDTEECFPPTLILHGSLNGGSAGSLDLSPLQTVAKLYGGWRGGWGEGGQERRGGSNGPHQA